MTSSSISIAVLTYNQEAFIGETLDSILSQDYQNFKIVVSDDASRDGTVAIVKNYMHRYPGKIILQAHEKNIGVTANCNSIIPLLDGEYICWFAGDDLFLPGKLSRQAAILDASPDVIFCYHDVEVFDSLTNTGLYNYNNSLIGRKPFEGMIASKLLMHGCFIATMGTMVRRTATLGIRHRKEFSIASDWMYFTEIAHRGRVVFMPEVLARYRRHPGNLSKKITSDDEEKTYALMKSEYQEYGPVIRLGMARLHAVYTFKFLAAGYFINAGLSFRKLLGLLKCHPLMFGFVLKGIARSLIQRLALFLKTGRIFR